MEDLQSCRRALDIDRLVSYSYRVRFNDRKFKCKDIVNWCCWWVDRTSGLANKLHGECLSRCGIPIQVRWQYLDGKSVPCQIAFILAPERGLDLGNYWRWGYGNHISLGRDW
jgi:hypothetical protein